MRVAFDRYSGQRGFTPAEFRATANEVAGTSLDGFFSKAVESTEELDYTEALDWFGLASNPRLRALTERAGPEPKREMTRGG